MSEYSPPKSNILFTFGTSGYTAPNFNDVKFQFASQNRNLKAEIIGSELQRDYVKECKTYILGYNEYNVQILREDCIYGGIRDLSLNVDVLFAILDLSYYIKPTIQTSKELLALLKGTVREEVILPSTLKGWVEEEDDLSVYLKTGESSTEDLFKYVNIFQAQQNNLNKAIKGWSLENTFNLIKAIKATYKDTKNISKYIKSTIQQTEDLNMDIFKIWQHSEVDFYAFLHGWQEEDFYSYIKSTVQQTKNLITDIFKIWQHSETDFPASLHGWQVLDLSKTIQAFHIRDLPINLRATYLNNISAFLYAISPRDVKASISGFDTKNLSFHLKQVPYQGDFPSYIYGVPSINLSAYLNGKLAVEAHSDLKAKLTNFKEKNLYFRLNILNQVNLPIYLNVPRIKVDLSAFILPKVVYIRKNINVSFLENRDLAAIVNFPCFNSSFNDLLFSVTVKASGNLNAYLFGYDNSNIKDLNFSINAYDYLTSNKVELNYFNKKDRNLYRSSYTDLSYIKKPEIHNMDVITLYGEEQNYSNLLSSIYGHFVFNDLGAYIKPYSNISYDTKATSENFITLKLKNNIESFRKYVNLKLRDYAFQYYYFSGAQKAYRMDRNSHWVVRVEGYKPLPVGRGYEKVKVRKKYIFNLKNYNSIDDAITDMVDRVTLLRSSDLSASLNVDYGLVGKKERDLNFILITKSIFKTNRTLNLSVRPVFSRINDLSTFVNAASLSSFNNLNFNISGVDYKGSGSGLVDFNFPQAEDSPPIVDDADFVFTLGDFNNDS